MRGQAFITYTSIKEATEALTKINGLMIFGRRLEADFSQNTSDATHIMNGQYDGTIAKRRREKKEADKKKKDQNNQ